MAIPQGIVVLMDTSQSPPVQVGAANLDSNGNFAIQVSNLTVGTHNLQATYQGGGSDLGSSSSVLPQVVNPADTPTSTTLVSSVNPSQSGENVVFSGTVAET